MVYLSVNAEGSLFETLYIVVEIIRILEFGVNDGEAMNSIGCLKSRLWKPC